MRGLVSTFIHNNYAYQTFSSESFETKCKQSVAKEARRLPHASFERPLDIDLSQAVKERSLDFVNYQRERVFVGSEYRILILVIVL